MSKTKQIQAHVFDKHLQRHTHVHVYVHLHNPASVQLQARSQTAQTSRRCASRRTLEAVSFGGPEESLPLVPPLIPLLLFSGLVSSVLSPTCFSFLSRASPFFFLGPVCLSWPPFFRRQHAVDIMLHSRFFAGGEDLDLCSTVPLAQWLERWSYEP